jgi:BirA family biotin operon repressor/biotin-[acetyl-CoA-carboxylase] ligase
MMPETYRLGEVTSTMEVAHEKAQSGAVHGTAVVAARQVAGRGTRGRSWSAEAGGLWLSVVARPKRTDALEALSLRTGLALAALLGQHFPQLPSIELKWPNDLMLADRKLAGILCEARWSGGACQWVVIGVGLNVHNALSEELAGSATRLADWAAEADRVALTAPIIAAIADAARTGGPLTPAELNAFAARDWLAGRRIVDPAAGTADGITAQGALRLRLDAGPVQEVLGGVVTTPG